MALPYFVTTNTSLPPYTATNIPPSYTTTNIPLPYTTNIPPAYTTTTNIPSQPTKTETFTLPPAVVPSDFYSRFWTDKDTTDLTLVLGDEELKVHRIILSAYSQYFEAYFHEHPKRRVLSLEYDPQLIKKIISWMYGRTTQITTDELVSFLQLAARLEVTQLIQVLQPYTLSVNFDSGGIHTLVTEPELAYIISIRFSNREDLDTLLDTIETARDERWVVTPEAMREILGIAGHLGYLTQNLIRVLNNWSSVNGRLPLPTNVLVSAYPNYTSLPGPRVYSPADEYRLTENYRLELSFLNQRVPAWTTGLNLEYPYVLGDNVTLDMFPGQAIPVTAEDLTRNLGSNFDGFRRLYYQLPFTSYPELNTQVSKWTNTSYFADVSMGADKPLGIDGRGWTVVNLLHQRLMGKVAIREFHVLSSSIVSLLQAVKSLAPDAYSFQLHITPLLLAYSKLNEGSAREEKYRGPLVLY